MTRVDALLKLAIMKNREHNSLNQHSEPQNPLVGQGEMTPADPRGHGEGEQVRAGMAGSVDISLTNRFYGEKHVTEGNPTFYNFSRHQKC